MGVGGTERAAQKQVERLTVVGRFAQQPDGRLGRLVRLAELVAADRETQARCLDSRLARVAFVHQLLQDLARLFPRADLGGRARQPLADRKRAQARAVESHQHFERSALVTELVFVEVHRSYAAHQPLLDRRFVVFGEAREVLGSLGELASGDVDFTGKRQRADVVGLEQRHVLERRERALAVAGFAQNARALPVQLGDFGGFLRDLQAFSDQLEQPPAVLSASHDAEQPIEGDETPHVALDGARQRELAALGVAELVEQNQRRRLPQLRAAGIVADCVAERCRCLGYRRAVTRNLGRRPQALPADDLVGKCLDHRAEGLDRGLGFRAGRVDCSR